MQLSDSFAGTAKRVRNGCGFGSYGKRSESYLQSLPFAMQVYAKGKGKGAAGSKAGCVIRDRHKTRQAHQTLTLIGAK